MEFYELHPDNPQLRYINKAVNVLKEGGVIIYPTDTVYGIGCDIFNKEALQRVKNIKIDPDIKLLSFICSGFKDISKYAKISDYAYRTMKHLLPGPYTFILPAAKQVPKKLWSKRKTVGIRIPDNPIALKIVEDLGNPIISTSTTNRKGEVLYDPYEIRSIFNLQVDLMLSSGNLSGKSSSVIDLSKDETVVVREGAGDISMFV
jgi:tRNA threonylcarbamoyl adenosine modification protein (Sua5/YciO/YrdC/YwlC family)